MSILSARLANASPTGASSWWPRRFARAIRLGLLGATAGCASLFSVSQVQAQITVKSLIGDAVSSDTLDQYKEITEAIGYFNHGDVTGARRALKDAKDSHKKLPPSELIMAKMLASVNQPQMAQLAREELENCVKLHPEDPETYLIFGDQSFADRRFTDAELLFSQAKKLAADFKDNAMRSRNFQIRAEAGLAAVAEAREQWDLAKTHLEAWIAIVDPPGTKPRDAASAAAHDRLGRVMFKGDKSDDHKTGAAAALDQFKMAIDADEKTISPHIAMAQLYEEAAQKAAAKSDTQDEAKMHAMAKRFVDFAVSGLTKDTPKAAKLATLVAAAHWALETDQPTEARDYSKMALDADKSSLEAKFLRGVAARINKDIPTAETMLEDVFSSSPMNFAASNQYAQVLAEQNDKDKRTKALEIARINDKMFGGQSGGARSLETAATLGWVLYQMNDLANADKVMQAIVQSGNPSADALYYRARILQDVGKTEEAVKYLQAALKISKSFVHHQEAADLLKKIGTAGNTSESKKDDKSGSSDLKKDSSSK